MIEVRNLYKGYQKEEGYVVKGVSFRVEKGTIHGLIGHNGSGKTTIIKCLTGIYQPDEGEILIGGRPVYDDPAVKEKIGYVADSNQMFTNYRIRELVKFYNRIFPDFLYEDFQALNKIFNVNPYKKIGQLSKGQQMRVSFMLNMARNPEVLILDEPTSGLDAIAKKDLLDLLVSSVENRDMTVLISSHHLSELERVCDSVTMITKGQVQVDNGIDEVTGLIAKYQVVFPEGAPPELYNREDVLDVSNVGSVYTVVLPGVSEEFEKTMREKGAVLVEQMAIGLEESFVYMNRNMRGGQSNE
ncbi:MAG: ABC transporter ATP-binding protein [Roseburia sp.]|nr:ABC transporter ATP-binding protein [Roseburia sp.]